MPCWVSFHDANIIRDLSSSFDVENYLNSRGRSVALPWNYNTIVLESVMTVSLKKTVLPGMTIHMLKIRRPNGLLIFNMDIAIRR